MEDLTAVSSASSWNEWDVFKVEGRHQQGLLFFLAISNYVWIHLIFLRVFSEKEEIFKIAKEDERENEF